jgi:phosphate transport system permease protein
MNKRNRRYGDIIFKALAGAFALSIIFILMFLVYTLVEGAGLSISNFGPNFLFSSSWDPSRDQLGAAPFIFGTLVTSAIALLLGVPVSLGIAVFLSERAPPRIGNPVSYVVELLAAIPSVIYGLWGLLFLRPVMRDIIEPALQALLGFTPLFQGQPFGLDVLTAGTILAIMIIPTVSAISREVMKAVPDTQREAAISLGATRWETTKMAVISYGRSGIVGAVILGLGRALGETMAVSMVIGNRPEIVSSLLQPGSTMASVIAMEFTEASDPLYLSALIEIGLILFSITLIVNILARLLVWRTLKVRGGAEV